MYFAILATHNVVRWVVLITGLVAAVRAWRGWLGRGQWTDADMKAAKLFVGALSLQFVVGLLLFATSPLVRQALGDMGAAMKAAPVRYFIVEHEVMMLAAIAVAHVGLVRIKRAASDSGRFQTAAIWLGVAAAAVAGFTPWNRPMWPSV